MLLISVADLLDSQQVAELLGLSHHNSVTTYARRYPDFPHPVVVRGGGRLRLWARDDVQAWHDRMAAPERRVPVDSEQRQRIIEATRRLMLADPFQPLSVRRIAEEAGVPHPVLYRYVRTKDELLELVVADGIERIGAAMDAVAEPTWRALMPEVVRVVLANGDSVRLFALWLVQGGGSDRFAEAAIISRMLTALTADPACDGSAEVTASAVVAVAAVAALLVGALVFEPRIEHLLGPDVLTEEVLVRLGVQILELALTAGERA